MARKITGVISGKLYVALVTLSLFGVVETLLTKGFLLGEPPFVRSGILSGYALLVVLYLAWVAHRTVDAGWKLRPLIPDFFLTAILLGMFFPLSVIGSIIAFRMAAAFSLILLRKSATAAVFDLIKLNPARILLLSFFCGILAGAVLLMLPAATVDHHGAALFDAIFTAASALCVTGLAVQDTGTYFSGFGQTVIVLLVQVGGLGIMTFSTLYTILLGTRLGWRQEEHMREIMESRSASQMYRLILSIVSITFFFELIGAFFLYLRFLPDFGSVQAVKLAVFHSMAAFCNAGFSLFRNNLMGYTSDFVVNAVIMCLIIAGGLGFIVFDDIRANIRGLNPFSLRWSRLSVHTRLALMATVVLILGGTLAFFFIEFDGAMLHLSVMEKLMASVFHSVTCRTAGFNTLDIAAFRDASILLMMLLMFVGASPASTGGGIKTTTLAVLLLSVRAHLRSRERVEIYNRSIPSATVYKSISIVLFSLFFIITVTLMLLMTQPFPFLQVLFEAISAIGTVGLSTGITPNLDATGKLLVTLLMYVGRVGPLTIALALGEQRKVTMEFPTTRIVVG